MQSLIQSIAGYQIEKNHKGTQCLFDNIDEREYQDADLLLAVEHLPDFVTPWEGPCNFKENTTDCSSDYNKTAANFGKIIFPEDLEKDLYVRTFP